MYLNFYYGYFSEMQAWEAILGEHASQNNVAGAGLIGGGTEKYSCFKEQPEGGCHRDPPRGKRDSAGS